MIQGIQLLHVIQLFLTNTEDVPARDKSRTSLSNIDRPTARSCIS